MNLVDVSHEIPRDCAVAAGAGLQGDINQKKKYLFHKTTINDLISLPAEVKRDDDAFQRPSAGDLMYARYLRWTKEER